MSELPISPRGLRLLADFAAHEYPGVPYNVSVADGRVILRPLRPEDFGEAPPTAEGEVE